MDQRYTRHAVIDTALGELTISARDGHLTGVYFPHHWYMPTPDALGQRVTAPDDPVLSVTGQQLDEYLGGTRTAFDLPLATEGETFWERVWAMLTEIPYGRTTTYGELADRLGARTLAQAVGQAVGHNPISIIVPCHRVIGRTGNLTGYAGGLRRKQFLLDLEEPAAVTATRLF